MKSNRLPRLSAFVRAKAFVMMTSLQNIIILGAQGLQMLMGSKFLIKMTSPQNIVLFILMCCSLVILIASYLQQQLLTEAITYSSNFTYGSYGSNYLQQYCCLQQQLLTTKLLIAVINNSSAHFLTAAVPMATIPMTIPMTAILMAIMDAPFTNSSNNL